MHYTCRGDLQVILDKYPGIFQGGLGTFKGRKVKIEVDPGAEPCYFKARTLPFVVRQKVEEERTGTLSSRGNSRACKALTVGHTPGSGDEEWATPLVVVMKSGPHPW